MTQLYSCIPYSQSDTLRLLAVLIAMGLTSVALNGTIKLQQKTDDENKSKVYKKVPELITQLLRICVDIKRKLEIP